MAVPRLQPIDRSEIATKPISTRLRLQLAYFARTPQGPGAPRLGVNEYYFPAAEIARTLEDGVLVLVSPLDTAHMTEVELSEEQEDLLQWLRDNGVEHVRLLD
jgi:hypothetical protein